MPGDAGEHSLYVIGKDARVALDVSVRPGGGHQCQRAPGRKTRLDIRGFPRKTDQGLDIVNKWICHVYLRYRIL